MPEAPKALSGIHASPAVKWTPDRLTPSGVTFLETHRPAD
jgi:hypothetical protein